MMLEKRPRETRRPFAPRIQGFGVSGSQNCNLELGHAHIRDEESFDSPAANSLQDAANSLLGLKNSLFDAN
jgi:hypothetical protein